MPSKRTKRSKPKAAQAKASSSDIPSDKAADSSSHVLFDKSNRDSQSGRVINFDSQVVIGGHSIELSATDILGDFEGKMKRETLKSINTFLECELTEEDLWGDVERVVWDPQLPENYLSSRIGKICPDDTLEVTLFPPLDRIAETRLANLASDGNEVILDKALVELVATKDELGITKTELKTTKATLETTKTELDNMVAEKKAVDAQVQVLLANENLKSETITGQFSAFVNKKLEETRKKEFEKQQAALKHDLLTQLRGELRLQSDMFEEKLKRLEQDSRQERQRLEHDISQGRVRQQKLERDVEQLFRVVLPIRLRALLDKARDRFAEDLHYESWLKLSKEQPVDDFVIANLESPYRPSDDVIRWSLRYSNAIRIAGNEQAHEVEMNDIQNAVKDVPDTDDKKYLEALFTYVFKGRGTPV